MLKSEVLRLQRLAKKNAEKAAREIPADEARKNVKKQEKKSVDSTVDASESLHLFREMKERPF